MCGCLVLFFFLLFASNCALTDLKDDCHLVKLITFYYGRRAVFFFILYFLDNKEKLSWVHNIFG